MNYKNVYLILGMIITSMGTFLVINFVANFMGFLSYLGFVGDNRGSLLSWVLALVVVVAYCTSARQISDVREYMFKLDMLKAVSILSAVCAGIVEEVVFRKWVMDYLEANEIPLVLQIIASGLSFGVLHLLWGIRNVKAGINAALSTCLLGMALAVVYWLGDRSLAPCIVAHFLVTALIEPGMLIAADKNRLGYWSELPNKD